MPLRPPTPIIAIIGRPNVGKSRLFNRYAGHARALVEDRPGITRDRIVEEIEVEGRPILIVDTAGLDPDPELELENAVQAQAREAVAEADAILFVVDGKSGLLPEDEAIARTLRRTDKPVALAVNKIDRPEHMDRLNEFYGLGLGKITAISAEHGGGAFDALEELVRALPPTESAPARDGQAARVAIVGRPNVGKSSLVNRLLGSERVVVSNVPGTTRDAIDVELTLTGQGESEGARVVLVDTAGLRRPGRRTGVAERGSALMTVRAVERADAAILVVDACEGLTDQDAHVAGLILDRGRPCVVAANKWDLVETDDRPRVLEQIEHGLRFLPDAQIATISAKTGSRVGRLLPLARRAAEAAQRRIPTSELNRWLEESTRLHSPSMARRGAGRRPMKFFYAAQVGVTPPTFVLFCSDPNGVQASYSRFLENRLRECFDFAGTPIRLILRARRNDRDEDG